MAVTILSLSKDTYSTDRQRRVLEIFQVSPQ